MVAAAWVLAELRTRSRLPNGGGGGDADHHHPSGPFAGGYVSAASLETRESEMKSRALPENSYRFPCVRSARPHSRVLLQLASRPARHAKTAGKWV